MAVVTALDLSSAVDELRRHVAHHRMGFDCGCGERDNDGTILSVERDRDAVLHALYEIAAEVQDIFKHRCEFTLDDSGDYYHPCGVCGADGNA